jgi:hypothetical protein
LRSHAEVIWFLAHMWVGIQRIEVLKADIQKYTADAAQLTKEIAELDEECAR